MPYITQERRTVLANKGIVLSPGELNYLLTDCINRYYLFNEFNYQKINDVIGALECAKLEFYRRVAVPYENAKLAENGDVYALGVVFSSTDVVR